MGQTSSDTAQRPNSFLFVVSSISEAPDFAAVHLAFSAFSSYVVKKGQSSGPLAPTQEELLAEVQALLGGAQISEDIETTLTNIVGEL